METDLEVIEIIELVDNDLKTAITNLTNMFKYVNEGETIQNEAQREKDWGKKMNRVSMNYEIVIKQSSLNIIGVPEKGKTI